MKKIYITLIINVLFFSLPVLAFAEEYQKNVLIPIDTVATVSTDKFLYRDFVYNSNVNSSGNAVISFGEIHNNTISKTPVSINILLFDVEKKNIGFLTYCTSKDIVSSYSGFKIEGNKSEPFSIEVTSRYFISGRSSKDVGYIAVMDENKYCQIGGYKKYEGLTIEEIINGTSRINDRNIFQRIIYFLSSNVITSNMIIVISCFIVFFALGILLNELHMKMYGYKNVLSYLPVTNSYIAAKLVFGNVVALVYFVLYVLSLLLLLMKITFLLYITNVILLLLVCIVIVKLVTRNYSLFYLESSMKLLGHNSMTADYENRGIFGFGKRNSDNSENTDRDTSLLSSDEQILDLGYEGVNGSQSLEEGFNMPSSSNDNVINVNQNISNVSDSIYLGQNGDIDIDNSNVVEKSNIYDNSSAIDSSQDDSLTITNDEDEEEKSDFDDFF